MSHAVVTTKLKRCTASLPAPSAFVITDGTSDGGATYENRESERSVCASTGSLKGIAKHRTDTCADVGARILHKLTKLRWPEMNNGRT